MGAPAFVAVAVGATLGAWLRWLLGLWLNSWLPLLPLGTLTANLAGGYLAGLAMALFAHDPALSPELRLALITGFLGALTTFSTFSMEAVTLIQRGDYLWALGHGAAHLFGSLLMTALGVATFRLVFS